MPSSARGSRGRRFAGTDAEAVARLYGSIYAVVRRIPRGRVATYGQIAELAGIPGGARVAGAAMKVSGRGPSVSGRGRSRKRRGREKTRDPLPWQRVIGKASRLRGRIAIHDPVGAAIQRRLLEDEGVSIGDSGLVPLDRFGWLPTAGSGRGASPRRRPRSASTRRASSSRR